MSSQKLCFIGIFIVSMVLVFSMFANCSRSTAPDNITLSDDSAMTGETGTGSDSIINPADPDGDKLNEAEEAAYNTDPNNPDTDGDRIADGQEVKDGLDSTDPLIYNGLLISTFKVSPIITDICAVKDAIFANATEGDAAKVVLEESACVFNNDAFHFTGESDWMPNSVDPSLQLGFDDDYFAIHYTGEIYIPAGGQVTFMLSDSDDDGLLFINQNLIVADFKYPTTEPICAYHPTTPSNNETVTVSSESDWHRIDVFFFEKYRKVSFNPMIKVIGTDSQFVNLTNDRLRNQSCPVDSGM